MAFLGKGKKQDLLHLAQDFGVIISPEMKFIEIKAAIINSRNYDEEFARVRLETIVDDRKSEEESEKQRQEKQRQHELNLKELQRQYDLKVKEILSKIESEKLKSMEEQREVVMGRFPDKSQLTLNFSSLANGEVGKLVSDSAYGLEKSDDSLRNLSSCEIGIGEKPELSTTLLDNTNGRSSGQNCKLLQFVEPRKEHETTQIPDSSTVGDAAENVCLQDRDVNNFEILDSGSDEAEEGLEEELSPVDNAGISRLPCIRPERFRNGMENVYLQDRDVNACEILDSSSDEAEEGLEKELYAVDKAGISILLCISPEKAREEVLEEFELSHSVNGQEIDVATSFSSAEKFRQGNGTEFFSLKGEETPCEVSSSSNKFYVLSRDEVEGNGKGGEGSDLSPTEVNSHRTSLNVKTAALIRAQSENSDCFEIRDIRKGGGWMEKRESFIPCIANAKSFEGTERIVVEKDVFLPAPPKEPDKWECF